MLGREWTMYLNKMKMEMVEGALRSSKPSQHKLLVSLHHSIAVFVPANFKER